MLRLINMTGMRLDRDGVAGAAARQRAIAHELAEAAEQLGEWHFGGWAGTRGQRRAAAALRGRQLHTCGLLRRQARALDALGRALAAHEAAVGRVDGGRVDGGLP